MGFKRVAAGPCAGEPLPSSFPDGNPTRMASFSALFRIPRWLEKAWEETRIEPKDSQLPWIGSEEQETMPLPLLAREPGQ